MYRLRGASCRPIQRVKPLPSIHAADRKIIQNVVGADNDDSWEGDGCDHLSQPLKRTVKEAAGSLSVLEDFCEHMVRVPRSIWQLLDVRAIVAAQMRQMRPKKQTKITNFFGK